jgi:hypothetical protein
VVRRSTPEERGFPTRSVHTHAVDASEPGRLADLLIDTGVVELVGDRRPFEADLRTILAGSKDAAVRARALWRVLESRDYVAEFYAEALDDLVTLFQEWG